MLSKNNDPELKPMDEYFEPITLSDGQAGLATGGAPRWRAWTGYAACALALLPRRGMGIGRVSGTRRKQGTMKTILVGIVLLSLFGLTACGAASAQAPLATAQAPTTEEVRVPSIIDFHDDKTKDVLTAPATVQANTEFEITIMTFGGGCERAGDSAVLRADASAAVMVYDFTTASHPEVVCTTVLNRLPHTARLRFTKPGTAIIRVWGRRVGPETPPAGVPAVLEHRVTVQ